jgi:hypothetical protein
LAILFSPGNQANYIIILQLYSAALINKYFLMFGYTKICWVNSNAASATGNRKFMVDRLSFAWLPRLCGNCTDTDDESQHTDG